MHGNKQGGVDKLSDRHDILEWIDEWIHVAFEMTRATLRVSDQDNLASEILAEEVIAVAKAGERDPDRICEMTLDRLRSGAGPPAPMTGC